MPLEPEIYILPGLPPDAEAKSSLARVLQLMGRVIEEGRNAVQGLRSPQSGSLNLEQAFSRIQEELAIQEDVGFRVIVDEIGRASCRERVLVAV